MKSIMFLFTALLFFASCKKDSFSITGQVVGKWELRRTYGGGTPAEVYEPGNGRRYELTASHFTYYRDGQVIYSGTYEIIREKSANGEKYRIEFNRNNLSQYVRVEGNMLLIITEGRETDYAEFQKIG